MQMNLQNKETHRHQETNLLPKGINEELTHNYCTCEGTTEICCRAQGTVCNILQQPIMEQNLKRNIYIYIYIYTYMNHLCCCSVAKSRQTLGDPKGCSMPGLPDPHHLLEFAQVHVHWTSDESLCCTPKAVTILQILSLNLKKHKIST